MLHVGVLIPAYNEAVSIARVLTDLPQTLVSDVVVVDNGSTACTAVDAAWRDWPRRYCPRPDAPYPVAWRRIARQRGGPWPDGIAVSRVGRRLGRPAEQTSRTSGGCTRGSARLRSATYLARRARLAWRRWSRALSTAPGLWMRRSTRRTLHLARWYTRAIVRRVSSRDDSLAREPVPHRRCQGVEMRATQRYIVKGFLCHESVSLM